MIRPSIKESISSSFIPSIQGVIEGLVVTNQFLVNIIDNVGNSADGTDPNSLRWTDILAGSPSASNIININGEASGISVSFSGQAGVSANGRTPNDGEIPDNSWLTYIFVDSGTITVLINGLDDTKTYDVKIGASRNTTAIDRVGLYQIGSESLNIDAALNPPVYQTIEGVKSSSGTLTLTVDAETGSSFAYLNWFEIIEKTGGSSPSEPTNQELFDEMAALADFGLSVMQTTSGDGGAYEDTALTTLGGNNSNIQAFKGLGNNKPNVQNFEAIRALDPSTNEIWYASEGGYPLLRLDTNEGLGYLRMHNGNGLEYETNPGTISPSITAPFSVFLCMRIYPGARNERNGHFKERNLSHTAFVETVSEIQTTTPVERFKWSKQLFEIDGAGNWQFYLNGSVIDSGSGATLKTLTELLIGANGHPIENHFAFQFYKFGIWSASEKTTLFSNSEIIYPDAFPTQPYYDTLHVLTSKQFNTTTKEWDLNRNTDEVDDIKVVSFGGGNGIEGASTYQWYYYDDSNPNPFPQSDKLDYHLPFPGADGQNSTLNRNHYISGNGRGNPTIFNNPGIAPFIRLMCVITPIDSNGLEGEKIVSDWTVDNIG